MRVLIDGYNLLHVTGILSQKRGRKPLEHARETLLAQLASSLPPTIRTHTTVVFDAGPQAPRDAPSVQEFHGIRVLFARRHTDADSLIEELIRQDSAPRGLIVVSGDRQIQRTARRRGAQVWDSEPWYRTLTHEATRSADAPAPRELELKSGETAPTVNDVIPWLRIFGRPPEP